LFTKNISQKKFLYEYKYVSHNKLQISFEVALEMVNTQCGYEVPGMNLLRDLKTDIRLDLS